MSHYGDRISHYTTYTLCCARSEAASTGSHSLSFDRHAQSLPRILAMPTCKGLRQELIDCLLVSDCVMRDGKTVKECLEGDPVYVKKYGRKISSVPNRGCVNHVVRRVNSRDLTFVMRLHNSTSSSSALCLRHTAAGPGTDGVPEKCRQLQRAHTICVKNMVCQRGWRMSIEFTRRSTRSAG